MSRVEVVSPGALEIDEVLELQHLAFSDVMTEQQVSALLNRAYYEWTYHPPSGEARIAVVREEGRLIAMNSMFPLRLASGSERRRGWQSCQTATHPNARRRGLFSLCLQALMDTLEPSEVFLGFPNRNSTRGFEKIGWRVLTEMATWFTLARPGFGGRDVHSVAELGPRERQFLDDYSSQGPSWCIERSVEYLNWRYFGHPNHRYRVLVVRKNEQVVGVVVLGRTRLFGLPCALVMECLARYEKDQPRLLRLAARSALRQRALLVIAVGNVVSAAQGLRSLFAPVPAALTPRRMVLMGKGMSREVDHEVQNRGWRTQLGDWDAF